MTIQQQLVALLSGATDAGSRVYPPAPEQPLRPYITYQRISASSENVLSGSSGLINTRMQIDVYATTYEQAQTIAAQQKLLDVLMESHDDRSSISLSRRAWNAWVMRRARAAKELLEICPLQKRLTLLGLKNWAKRVEKR